MPGPSGLTGGCSGTFEARQPLLQHVEHGDRAADANDSRATRVYITDTGRSTFETLWPHMAATYTRMFRGISDVERAAFVGTLQKMLINIRKHEI